MSLRRRLLILISLVLLASLSVSTIVTFVHAKHKVAVELQSAIAVGETAALGFVENLSRSNEPTRQLQHVVEAFNGDRHLKAAWIGPTGLVMLESKLLPPYPHVPSWFDWLFTQEPLETRVHLPSRVADLGYILLKTDAHNEIEEVWVDFALKALIDTAFSAAALALVYSVLGSALRPLENLARALGRVGGGDYAAQVPVSGPLELSAIYREFNRMADRLAESERQNRRLTNQVLTVQEEERADIARDLHDEVGPFLFAIDVDARAIGEGGGEARDRQPAATADNIRASVAHIQKHLRTILARLRPTAMLDLGLDVALDQMIEYWRKRYPEIQFNLNIERSSFGSRIDDVCYRVIQECLSNAVRHGAPRTIDIEVKTNERDLLYVRVLDDGAGLPAAGARPGKGFGMAGMRERLHSLGGELTVANRADRPGVAVCGEIPLVTVRSGPARDPVPADATSETRS